METAQVILAMKRVHGTDISWYDRTFLEKSVADRYALCGVTSDDDYLTLLSGSAAEARALTRSLRITYSEFFRNPLTFAFLEERVLPSLVREKQGAAGGEVRVWSAGCAAGQEAYSIAILLDELVTGLKNPVSFRIFATDRSEEEIARARSGVYPRDAVKNVRQKHIGAYFRHEGDTYTVVPRLRELVMFSCHDLLDEFSSTPPSAIYGDFDLVICSNLLFYYRGEVRRVILDRLDRSLVEGGYLVTGEAERDMVGKIPGMRPAFPQAAVFRKGGGA